MKKCISILGSTGSIGVQALDVARNLGIKVSGLSANTSIDILEKQILEFKPRIVSVATEELACRLSERIKGSDTEVFFGVEGLEKVATIEEVDTVLTSVVGIAGLIPTMSAIKKGKNIALANKETLVTAGSLVMAEAKKMGVSIIPVDSEHSAIFQCIMGNDIKRISKIILTASGGPFRGISKSDLENVTLEQALNHPNWSMGSKITIDSATLMNKGLEVIEAKWLFGIESEQIEVLVHPQSIIHSMVEYVDGSVIAQLGSPDMRIPIQFALTYPDREYNSFPKLDLLKAKQLTFENPDYEAFPCLKYAFDSLDLGGTMPAALNGANEVAVAKFLNREIKFMDIIKIIIYVMNKHIVNINPTLYDIIEVDKWARKEVENYLRDKN